MKVHEVMERTGLTRKALYYYEEIGIVRPDHDPENNYREYSSEDVRGLLMVAGLLQLGVPVGEISARVQLDGSLAESGIAAILENRLSTIAATMDDLERQQNLITACIRPDSQGLMERVTIASRAAVLEERERSSFMKKQLQNAFPGNFGQAMSAIFAPFLGEPIDSPEKERAWISLVKAIDEFDPLVLPEAIQTLSQDMPGSTPYDFGDLQGDLGQLPVLEGEDARLAVVTAEYLVHHAGAFLEPFFGFLEVLSSRFRSAKQALIRVARSLEDGTDGI